jgi:hypothetical protein
VIFIEINKKFKVTNLCGKNEVNVSHGDIVLEGSGAELGYRDGSKEDQRDIE